MAPHIESLPTEMKHKIFGNLTRISDLKSLVHASAIYHQTYISDGTREKVLTGITLSELDARDVKLFAPVPFLEVCLKDRGRLGAETEAAIVNARGQKKAQIRARGEGIRLSVKECIALRNIQDILPWTIDDDVLSLNRSDEYVFRALINGHQNYHGMTDSPATLARFRSRGLSREQISSRFMQDAKREFWRRHLGLLVNGPLGRLPTEIIEEIVDMVNWEPYRVNY